jgi:hypothetical protein
MHRRELMMDTDDHYLHALADSAQADRPADSARTVIATLVDCAAEVAEARLLVRSIRAFGGAFSNSPVYVFHPAAANLPKHAFESEATRVIPIEIKHPNKPYRFAYKALASATAEAMIEPGIASLVWLDCASLCLEPPVLFDISPKYDLAVRPVHIRNVGSLASEQLDDFWKVVYRSVGIDELPNETVESFMDKQIIRPYFNCCAYVINPALGILGRWWDCFQDLVGDIAFQSGPCSDELHQIFLHQAVFSALIVKYVAWDRIRPLPPSYWYPLHLHTELTEAGRALSGADVVGILTDYISLDPSHPFFENCSESFRAWLAAQLNELNEVGRK